VVAFRVAPDVDAIRWRRPVPVPGGGSGGGSAARRDASRPLADLLDDGS